ncbi:DNA polymerase III subunit delta [Pseudoalteromonas sp. MTN2-4]|uniref:DNA polymerase III subunit delta n=1 Tax=Pseudoalteromonas sp. MTN2-4 TaxID=3056555 RepID=UPI0036F36CB2
MRCYANQLPDILRKGLAPFYLVLGEEPFQEAQCVQQIKQAAKQQGFDEVIKFSLLQGFDWQELLAQYNSMSLFSARTLIEFDLNQQKPGTAGSDAFKQLTAQPNPDVVLIVKGQKASQEIQRGAWFKGLEKQGVYVPCYELTGQHLQRWLDSQAKQLKVALTQDAKKQLLLATEGNLLATHQELEKLALLYPSQTVNDEQILAGLLNQSKFDIFDLTNATLAGQAKKITKVMVKLAEDNTEPNTLVWALNKQQQTLVSIKQGLQQGKNITALYKQHNIWKNQQPLTQQALDRLPLHQLEQIGLLLAQIDSGYKRGELTAPYQALLHCALSFCYHIPIGLPINHTD